MKTEIITVKDDFTPLEKAAQIIRKGGLVVFPTETVYGLGANALNAEACKNIYAAKGRPSDNPLIIHISDTGELEKYTKINTSPDSALMKRLAESFMPGPVTMILPKADIIPSQVTAGLDTVAVRFPSHPVARKLIELSGVPIAAPSANLSGSPSPTTAQHVINDLDGRVDMIIDGGACDLGLESTIIMPKDGRIKLLRPGAVTLEQLSEFAPVDADKALTQKLASSEKPLAPGMKYRHYAPRASVGIVSGENDAVCDFFNARLKEEKTAVLCFEEQKERLCTDKNVFSLGHRGDDIEQGRLLFVRLREIDKTDCERAYACEPSRSGVGFAVYNRLIKACGFEVIKL